MLMYSLSDDLSEDAAIEIRRLARRDMASDADQKFTIISFPFVCPTESADEVESVICGASAPISREWLPEGMEDERKAAITNEKIILLVFTIACFRYTIVIRRRVNDAFFMDEQ